jgi:hypothetical protein
MALVGGSPTSNHFLLFVQKKVIKENHTPLPRNPSVLAQRWYGCGTRPRINFGLKQSSPFNPAYAQAEGAASGKETMRWIT